MILSHAAVASRPAPGSPEATPLIDVRGVARTYSRGSRETRALDGIDLTIGDGEFIAIVGPSGCGKSTLLRIVAGLLPASEGTVTVLGNDVTGPQTELGIVFQSPVLLDWRSALGNVLVQIELRGMDVKAYEDRAKQLLGAVGLGDFLDRYPHELSGGMRQRAAIVRALIHDPPILLMDEPFGALDALTREQLRIDLEYLWLQTKKTVLFITHSIDEAVLLADRVAVMTPRPGKIEQIFDVNLPRPRGVEARHNPDFTRLTDAITGIFLDRGVLHRGSVFAQGPGLISQAQVRKR